MNADKFNRLLITFLAHERCLFDPNCNLYNSINERHQAYLRIGSQLKQCGASDAQVSKVNDRYQALKRRFISEHSKVQKGKNSTWPYYTELEKLLSVLVEKTNQNSFGEPSSSFQPPPNNNLNIEPTCSTSSYVETPKKRKLDDERPATTSQTDFSGIFDYLATKMNNFDEQTQKNVIEKLLKIVHNPTICLVEERLIATNAQWPAPPDQY
ncbi:hypothetical protein M3Y97_00076600 [Aphelenchoides bicaudatus]|nr:hypothetical protein M3Y97_00076600 [Aphelenchoides bicaudatus]